LPGARLIGSNFRRIVFSKGKQGETPGKDLRAWSSKKGVQKKEMGGKEQHNPLTSGKVGELAHYKKVHTSKETQGAYGLIANRPRGLKEGGDVFNK